MTIDHEAAKLTAEILKAYSLIAQALKLNSISSSAALSGSLTYVLECLYAMKVPMEKIHEVGDLVAKAAVDSGAELLAKVETKDLPS